MTPISSSYPNFREAMGASYAHMSDAELESLFESAFGEGISPAEYEEFFGGLGQALSRVGQVAASALPGAIQGAQAGAVAGPWGMLGGALAGGVGSALQRHGRGDARRVGAGISGVVNAAGALTGGGGGAGGLASMLGGSSGGRATNGFLSILSRPDTQTALRALSGGRNPAIRVGNTSAPASAFAGLLGSLAREAEAESVDASDAPHSYLLNSRGQLVVNPNEDEQRAARLLQLLRGNPVAFESDESDEAEGLEFDEEESWSELDEQAALPWA